MNFPHGNSGDPEETKTVLKNKKKIGELILFDFLTYTAQLHSSHTLVK